MLRRKLYLTQRPPTAEKSTDDTQVSTAPTTRSGTNNYVALEDSLEEKSFPVARQKSEITKSNTISSKIVMT